MMVLRKFVALSSAALFLIALTACGAGNGGAGDQDPGPQVVHDAPEFQAVAGTYNQESGIETVFKFMWEPLADGADLEFKAEGPAGWNDGASWTAIRSSTPGWVLRAATPPVSGDFLFTSVRDGVTYTDSMTLDADRVLGRVQGIEIADTGEGSIEVTWDALDGAVTYYAMLRNHDSGRTEKLEFTDGDTREVVFDIDGLDRDVSYTVHIHAFDFDFGVRPDTLDEQIAASISESEPFKLPAEYTGPEFTVSFELDAAMIDPDASITLHEVTAARAFALEFRPITAYTQPAVPGRTQVTVDADEVGTVPLMDFLHRLLLDSNPERLAVSLPGSEIRVLAYGNLNQHDATGDNDFVSHWLEFLHEYDAGGNHYRSQMYLVYSDAEVHVDGLSTNTHVDFTLVPGWNFVYSEHGHMITEDFQAPIRYYARRARTSEASFTVSASDRSLFRATKPEYIHGIATYAVADAALATAERILMHEEFSSLDPQVAATFPAWIPAGGTDTMLTDLAAALGTDAARVRSEQEAAFMGLTALVFGETVVGSTDWWTQPAEHTHVTRLTDADGNPVLYVYTDRTTRVHLDQANLAVAPGGLVSTDAFGLQLRMGWNRIVLEPGTGSTYTPVQVAGPNTAGFVPAAD